MPYLTATQLAEWEVYDRLDPIGGERGDFRNAHLISEVVNIAISIWGKENAKLTTPMDFMPRWGRKGKRKKAQSPEELKQSLLSIFGGMARAMKPRQVVKSRATPPKRLAQQYGAGRRLRARGKDA